MIPGNGNYLIENERLLSRLEYPCEHCNGTRFEYANWEMFKEYCFEEIITEYNVKKLSASPEMWKAIDAAKCEILRAAYCHWFQYHEIFCRCTRD